MGVYCGYFCEVCYASCLNYDYKNNYCKVKQKEVDKYDSCHDDFHCELTGLNKEEIKALARKKHADGFRR